MTYEIGVLHGLGADKDGKPEIHALDKINESKKMLDSGEIEKIILAVKGRTEARKKYLVENLGFPEDKIYENEARGLLGFLFRGYLSNISFVGHLSNIRRNVDRWIKKREIPPNVRIHHFTNPWAVERLEFDIGWVSPNYSYVIHEVEDHRPKEVVLKYDIKEEPRRKRIDEMASKIPILSTYQPDIAYLIPATWEFIKHPCSLIEKGYGKRFLPR